MEVMNTAMVKTWTRLLAGAAAFALASCAWEKEDFDAPVRNGEAMVTFALQVPGVSAPASRALSAADENTVTQIDVLVFEPNGGEFVYRTEVDGTKIDTDGSDSRIKTFTVALRQGSFDLALMANSSTVISAASLDGLTKAQALATLETAMPAGGKWIADATTEGYRPLPMWGDVGNIAIGDATELTGSDRVLLTRMAARVIVQATGTAATNFRITAVDIYNYNTRGSLVPRPADWNTTVPSAPKADHPNVPASSTLTRGPIHYTATDPTTAYANEIYIFEAENHIDAAHTAGKGLTARTCAVVGGHWDSDADGDFADEGSPTWYRVDFSTGTGSSQVFLDVLRNHNYLFNITKVSGRGYADSETAFNSAPVNIEAGVQEWNHAGMGDVVADGQYALSVGSASVELEGRSYTADGTENKLRILTDYPGGWKIESIRDAATDAEIPDNGWISIADDEKAGTDKTVSLILGANGTGAARSAKIRITAGRMVIVVVVTQEPSAPGYGGYGDLLFFDSDGRLSIGRWASMSAEQRANLAYFKFGGVVGFTGVAEAWLGAYATGKELKFNTTGDVTYATWLNIPRYEAADFTAGRTNVSATTGDYAYHTGANVKLGKGDPCRLIGLTGAQIQAMTEAQIDAHNSGWRLPTVEENKAFTGYTEDATFYSDHWTSIDGMNGGMFPNKTVGTPDMFLPARGYRVNSGGSYLQGGSHGHYWSNSAVGTFEAYSLYLRATLVSVENTAGVSMGYNVRCIRND
ncbi:MAG: FimB/Mfa2 family fimbrial subunit [Tannerellaceae bacterium]|jgi:uncharacterized protein (TIGR02145 family)|nr:FimB/Mfa2 family fimbrial subunit [Tannerellaceae bacterium]